MIWSVRAPGGRHIWVDAAAEHVRNVLPVHEDRKAPHEPEDSVGCGGGCAGKRGGDDGLWSIIHHPGGLEISAKGEELAYDKAALEATARQQVALTFRNTSAGQNHTWLLVNGGDDLTQTVADSAAATADYLPADQSSVIATTKVLPGGQSESIAFTAPAAGTYTFLHTYPGHCGAGMKGTLTVG